MSAEQRNRRLWMGTAIIFAAWAVFGLLVANPAGPRGFKAVPQQTASRRSLQ